MLHERPSEAMRFARQMLFLGDLVIANSLGSLGSYAPTGRKIGRKFRDETRCDPVTTEVLRRQNMMRKCNG